MKIFKGLLLALLSLPMLATAKGDGYKIDFEEYDLDNGLHVIIHENHTAPLVQVGIMYHVGSKNEELDKTGFAHLFEHLMFHGSAHVPQGEYEKIVKEAGGSFNASTSQDRTYYYTILPSHQYKLPLWLEAERMRSLNVTEAGVRREKSVVEQEYFQTTKNKPMGSMFQHILEEAFPDSPYGWDPIGNMDQLKAAGFDEIARFHDTYYVPNNACLSISGDIDPKEVKKWVANYFGSIPRGKYEIVRPDCVQEKVWGDRRITKTDRIKRPQVVMTFPGTAMTTREARVLEFITNLLTSDADFSLKNMVAQPDSGKARNIQIFPISCEKDGLVIVRAVTRDSTVTPEQLIASIDGALTNFKTMTVPAYDLERMHNVFESSYTDAFINIAMINQKLAERHLMWSGAESFNNLIEDYLTITAEEVQAVAEKYFTTDNRVVITYHPNEMK